MGGAWRMHILVLLCCVFIISTNGKKSASSRCRVRRFEKKLDCRGVGFSRIPKIDKGILIADFTDNYITHFTKEDLGRLRKLQKVYLNGNPLHCDCNLERLRLGRKNLPVIQDVDNIQCKTPYHLRDKPLNSLSDLCGYGRIMLDHNSSLPNEINSLPNENSFLQDGKSSVGKGKDGSINCTRNINCPTGRVCTNHTCQCRDGYYEEGGNCEDIDECMSGSHKCGKVSAYCKNNVGSYTCECTPGFKMENEVCVDINECDDPYVCGEDVSCVNSPGSFGCECLGDMKNGYFYVPEVKQCIDVDECKLQPCNQNTSTCKNSHGSYKCDCKPGYKTKESHQCIDIDECTETAKCKGQHRTCSNTVGSFLCRCGAGFIFDEFATKSDDKCKDIDECKTRKHNCEKQSHCRNIQGSFKCECPDGYNKDGLKCRPTWFTRWFTPKILLRDLKNGALDTLGVAGGACLIVLVLFLIFVVRCYRKCRRMCSRKPGYKDQYYYPEEVYDPDQMFFAENEGMYYPDEMAYHGDSTIYPEGYPVDGMYPEGYPADGMYPEGYPADGMYPEGYPADGMYQEGYPSDGMYQEGYPADGMYQEGYPEEEYYPEGMDDATGGLGVAGKSIFNIDGKDPSENVPVTFYEDDNEDLSDEHD